MSNKVSAKWTQKKTPNIIFLGIIAGKQLTLPLSLVTLWRNNYQCGYRTLACSWMCVERLQRCRAPPQSFRFSRSRDRAWKLDFATIRQAAWYIWPEDYTLRTSEERKLLLQSLSQILFWHPLVHLTLLLGGRPQCPEGCEPLQSAAVSGSGSSYCLAFSTSTMTLKYCPGRSNCDPFEHY